jgi:protein involved in polysaccharide export with SLBB domain
MRRYIIFLGLFLIFGPVLFGQSPARMAQIEAFLEERKITREELTLRLQEEGIDVVNLSEAELLALRPRIETIIKDLEAEKALQNQSKLEEIKVEQSPSTNKMPPKEEPAPKEEEEDTLEEEASEERIFGHQLFRDKSLDLYSATEDSTPPDSYPLKVGDELSVTIFGISQADLLLRVNEQGFVKLPNQVQIALEGVSLGEARRLLADRLKNYYSFRDGQLSIRVQIARSVSINILGEVETSGRYTISALNTGFNALVAAGGPTERGSVRNIRLIRGEETTVLDVYDYLRNPIQRSDLFLADNSTILVPLAETVVTLTGGVLRPMQYELIKGEGIADLLRFAGNALPEAETSIISVTRYDNGVLEVINVDAQETPDFQLLNGDVINVPIVENPVEDFVTIEGAVILPGRYAFEEGISVEDLLEKGRLRPSSRTDVAFLFRSNDDGTSRLQRLNLGEDAGAMSTLLQRGDRLQVLSQRAFTDPATFTVSGAVRADSVTLPFPVDGALTLEEAVLLAGGAKNNAASQVMLIRTPPDNREARAYKKLDLGVDGEFTLMPLDQILVYSNERFNDDDLRVSIAGAVREPGTYIYDASLTLQDLIYLAGGLNVSAARDRIEIFRLGFSNGTQTRTMVNTLDIDSPEAETFELKVYDEVVVRSAAEFERIQNVVVRGEVRYPGQYALLGGNEKITDLINRAGGLTTEAFVAGASLERAEDNIGKVVLDLEVALNSPGAPSDMVLRGGDTLYIPKQQDLVTIYLNNTIADEYGVDSLQEGRTLQVSYQGPKPANWYIKRYAGGFDDDAARKRWTTVQYANGQIQETSSFMGFHSYPKLRPGASIRIPPKPPKKQKARREERFNWIGLAQVFTGAATTIVTFILLRQ